MEKKLNNTIMHQMENHGEINPINGIGGIKLDDPIILYNMFIIRNRNDFEVSVSGSPFHVMYSWKGGLISFLVYVPTGRIVEITANQNFNGTFLNGIKFGENVSRILKEYTSVDIYPMDRLMSPEFKGFFIQLPEPIGAPEYFTLNDVINLKIEKVGIFSRFEYKNDSYIELYGAENCDTTTAIPDWAK